MKASGDEAEVGIGTLVVFIAMVLVAAVAAAVLINTSGLLQARASATGKQATQSVTSNLMVLSIYGQRNNTLSSSVDVLKFDIGLAAGAPAVDITKLVIRYSDGSNVVDYTYSGTKTFAYSYVRDVSTGAADTSNKVMTMGDVVEFAVGYNETTAADHLPTELAPRTPVEVTFIPETGGQVPADFTTPPTYGSSENIPMI
ncbi:MAG: archaellin/type IV pilin N-terminal domain-containing protein [Thermoplasmatota archaeon]